MKNCLIPKNPKMCDPFLVTLLKMRPYKYDPPSSGTSPLASYKEVRPLPTPRAIAYIDLIICKANKMLGLIYRTCTNEWLCWPSVNPTQLEYASRVWSHYTKRKIMAIERVQRCATKFILRCDFSITYPERLVKLGLLPLDFKREVIDLWFVFTSLWTYWPWRSVIC